MERLELRGGDLLLLEVDELTAEERERLPEAGLQDGS